MGLIAQEVEEIFPEVIGTGPDGMKGINYAALIAPLIEAMKQQQVQIDRLRADVSGPIDGRPSIMPDTAPMDSSRCARRVSR